VSANLNIYAKMDEDSIVSNGNRRLYYSYQLTVYGSDSMMLAFKEAKGAHELKKIWKDGGLLTIRRRSFPSSLPNIRRLSRKHFRIECLRLNGEKTFSIMDLSQNGVRLNGELIGKGSSRTLKDGDEIGIIWRVSPALNNVEVLLGLKFTAFNEKNAPLVQFPSSLEMNEELMAREDRKRKHTISENIPNRKSRKITNSLDERAQPPEEKEDEIGETPKEIENNKKLPTKKLAKQWSLEDEEKLRRVVQSSSGKSWKDIAAHFPTRSPDAVRNKFKKILEVMAIQKRSSISEVSPNRENTKERDDKKNHIKTTMDSLLPSSSAYHSKATSRETKTNEITEQLTEDDDRRRKPWTSEDDEKLKMMIIEHQPKTPEDWETVAAELGRTVKSIKHKFNDYNLKRYLR